jgi:hypothetical protein
MQGLKLKFTCKHYLRQWESVTFSSGMDMPGPKRCLRVTCCLRKNESGILSSGMDMPGPRYKLDYVISVKVVSHPLIRDGYAGSEINVSLL